MTTFQPLLARNCTGGHTCSPPKDCCKQGCCYLLAPPISRPPTVTPGSFFNPLFLGHWYFWLAVTATVAGILCACSLWRRHTTHGSFCCRDSARDERASEPDSNGSCYAPPQYSRCNSFHQPPPPYSEVTSKPDLYPLVINYNGDPIIKNNNSSTGYLMVQYFRNFIVRPVGSLSATSTIDSLSSSFICNAANEANMQIPPPYSCMGSLEEVTSDPAPAQQATASSPLPHSTSDLFRSPSGLSQQLTAAPSPSALTPCHIATANRQVTVSIRDNPCFEQSATNILNNSSSNNNNNFSNVMTDGDAVTTTRTTTMPNNFLDDASLASNARIVLDSQSNCDATAAGASPRNSRAIKPSNVQLLLKNHSLESESQEDEHNFSDLLNLSVCGPSSIVNFGPVQPSSFAHHPPEQYSVTNSMTGSDISSLANLGSPDSPPRATSPTLEMKELLNKIQQLPHQQKSPEVKSGSRGGFHNRAKAKTLYMPLSHESAVIKNKSKMLKGWLSRSAPNTPCGNFVPSFPVMHKGKGGSSQKCSKVAGSDGSPLLREHEESEEDSNKDECL